MSDETTSAPTGDSGVDFDAMFTTEPTTTETAPAAASEAPSASPATAEAPESTGPARDASGRFAPKAAEPAAETPEGESPAPAPEPRPFQYRAAGETRAWEGVTEQPDGSVVVPASAVGDLRAALNARVLAEGQLVPVLQKHQQENASLKAELQRVQQGKTVEAQQAQALVQAFGRVLDPTMDDGAAVESFFALRSQWPTLLAEAKAEFYKQQIATPPRSQAPAQPETARSEAPALPSAEQAWQTTQEYVEQMKLDPAFRDVSADDWKQLVPTLQRTPFAFVRPAAEHEAQYPGEVVFDVDALHAHLLATVTRQREARETAARQAKLAADNARKTQPSVTAPPTVGRSATPLAPERTKLDSPEDVDNWLFNLTA